MATEDIKPTKEFAKRTKEAKEKLAPAVGEEKKPKVGGARVTVGTVYTLKGAAKEALTDDEKKKAAERGKV